MNFIDGCNHCNECAACGSQHKKTIVQLERNLQATESKMEELERTIDDYLGQYGERRDLIKQIRELELLLDLAKAKLSVYTQSGGVT